MAFRSFSSRWDYSIMQVKLWYPTDVIMAKEVPFYVPVKAIVSDPDRELDEKNLEYSWELDNNLLSDPIGYSAYSRKNILAIAFFTVGVIKVTVTVTDRSTGETVSESIEVFGQITGEDGIYKFDEEPVATFYDDRYVPNFSVEFKKRFKAGDIFSGAYNYFLGAWILSKFEFGYDYAALTNEVKDLINRTTQPDQMWERYMDSDCVCYYHLTDPVKTYYPNKFNLMHLYNNPYGIGFHIKVNNDYPIYLAQERLFQAVRFVCFLHGIDIARQDYSRFKASHPITFYDEVLDKLDVYMTQKYDQMKSIIDLDNMYELMCDTTDDFLGQKSYDDDIGVYDWTIVDDDFLQHSVDRLSNL